LKSFFGGRAGKKKGGFFKDADGTREGWGGSWGKFPTPFFPGRRFSRRRGEYISGFGNWGDVQAKGAGGEGGGEFFWGKGFFFGQEKKPGTHPPLLGRVEPEKKTPA